MERNKRVLSFDEFIQGGHLSDPTQIGEPKNPEMQPEPAHGAEHHTRSTDLPLQMMDEPDASNPGDSGATIDFPSVETGDGGADPIDF